MLSGVASGATLAGPDPLPSTTRIVLLRVPDPGCDLAATNGYMAQDPVAISANLALVGIQPQHPDAAAAELAAFLCGGDAAGLNQVGQTAHGRLAGFFDAVAAYA